VTVTVLESAGAFRLSPRFLPTGPHKVTCGYLKRRHRVRGRHSHRP